MRLPELHAIFSRATGEWISRIWLLDVLLLEGKEGHNLGQLSVKWRHHKPHCECSTFQKNIESFRSVQQILFLNPILSEEASYDMVQPTLNASHILCDHRDKLLRHLLEVRALL